jgi:hypothetical protein
MVDLDIVKSMTDLCDGGALINGNGHIYKDVIDICVDGGHISKNHHRGAEEARRAHNPKDG